MDKYNKFWVAAAGAAVIVLTRHFGLENIYVMDLITVLTALGVYAVPNAQR